MTPAIDLLDASGIKYQIHEYDHDPQARSFGKEAAEKLHLNPAQIFKTLVATPGEKELVVAIIPVSAMLNLKALAKVVGRKKAVMADKMTVEKTTGYVLGGVSPLGQKKRLKTVIDVSAFNFARIFVSGGKRGLDIELSPTDLQALTQAQTATIT